jgi:hypothetical protein
MNSPLKAEQYLRQLLELTRDRFPDPKQSERSRLQHVLRDHHLTRMISEGAASLGRTYSEEVTLPTPLQDRYEYVILGGLAAKLRKVAAENNVTMPDAVAVGSLPSGHLDAFTFKVPQSNEYVIAYHSGLFAYLYLLSRIVVSCIPWRPDPGTKGVLYDVNPDTVRKAALEDAAAAGHFENLVAGCLFDGNPWLVQPFKLKPELATLAVWLAKSAQGFVLGHEFGHIQNGDFDRLDNAQHTGESPAGIFDSGYHREFAADFTGLQNMFAVMSDTPASFMFSYWGTDLFFSGIDSLRRSLAVIMKGDPSLVPLRLHTTLYWRQRALREGMRFYLKDLNPEQVDGAIALGRLASQIIDALWQRTYDALINRRKNETRFAAAWQAFDPDSNPYMRDQSSLVEDEAFREGVYAAIEAARTNSEESLQLLDQLAPAVILTLFEDISDEREEIRNKALTALVEFEPEFDVENNLPYLRYFLARVAATNTWVGDSDILETILDMAARVQNWAQQMRLKRRLSQY